MAWRSAPASRSIAARSSARLSVLGNWKDPVSVMIPMSAAVAISGVHVMPSASMTRDTSSAVAALVTSTRLYAPNCSFEAWWSRFTTGGRFGSANFARSAEPKSTVTTRSKSSAGGSCVKRSDPVRKRDDSGTGSAQCQDTVLPIDSRPRPRARPAPIVSGSGSRCETIAMRRAFRSASRTGFSAAPPRAPGAAARRCGPRAPPTCRGRM